MSTSSRCEWKKTYKNTVLLKPLFSRLNPSGSSVLYVLQYQETLRSVGMVSVFPMITYWTSIMSLQSKDWFKHIHEICLIDAGTHVVCV